MSRLVLADLDLVDILDDRGPLEEEDTVDQQVGVLHFLDGFLILVLAELLQSPVLEHVRMLKNW